MKKVYYLGLFAAGVTTLFTACTQKEIFDGASAEQAQKEAYAVNFVKQYPNIDLNTQSWDFTANKVSLGTRAGDEISVELVDGLDFGIEESVDEAGKFVETLTKNVALFNDVPMKLPDKVKHQGESAILIAPSNDFYIYPISCQGAWKHDFFIKVGNEEPVHIYNKFWTDASKPYINGMATNKSVKNGQPNVTKRAEMPGIHVIAPTGSPVEIYLDNINNGGAPKASTVTGSAIVIDTDVRPEGVPIQENSVVQYIGMEDRYDYDFDYNDMVMVVVGNPDTPPTEKIIDEKYSVKTNITKRYMIEDLGATDDFDFNDIVVDVTENTTETHRRTYKATADGEKGDFVADIVIGTTKSQKATIVHLGGTLPFKLKIGETDFGELEGQLDVDVKIEKNIKGWDPEKNNVSIEVQQKNGAYYTIKFPKAGEAPMIIAVKPEQKWMHERKCVPSSWFYIPE